MIDESKNLQRDDGQHAGHQVQDQSADKSQAEPGNERLLVASAPWRGNRRASVRPAAGHARASHRKRHVICRQQGPAFATFDQQPSDFLRPAGLAFLHFLAQPDLARAGAHRFGGGPDGAVCGSERVKVRFLDRPVRRPLDEQRPGVVARVLLPPGAREGSGFGLRQLFLPGLQKSGVRRGLGLAADAEPGGKLGIAGHAKLGALQPRRPGLEVHRARGGVGRDGQRDQQDDLIVIDVGDQALGRKLLRHGPKNVARGDA